MPNGAKQAVKKRQNTRDRLWPDAASVIFDPSDRTTKGYSQVPRVVPIVARLINEIGGPENAGSLYQVLWAQEWGQGIVEVRSYRQLLYEAGYSAKGSRIERTWQERIRILENLGFIRTARRGLDDHAYILLIDPHLAVVQLETALPSVHKATFGPWREQFSLVCEQWGIDLDEFRTKLEDLRQRDAS